VEQSVQNVAAQRPGEWLAAERERQGLTCSDVAQRLHMSVSQVEALESGDYGRLPRGPFLRGFFRNYAKLLNVAPDSILAMLEEAAPRPPAPGIVVPSQNIRFDPLGERLGSPYVKAASLAAVAIAVGFAAMYWWLFVRAPATPGPKAGVQSAAPRTPAVPPVTVAPVPPPPTASGPGTSAAVEPGANASSNGSVSTTAEPASPRPEPATAELSKAPAGKADAPRAEPPKAEVAKTVPPKPEPAKAPAGGFDADGSVLRFRFGGESWVEVRDSQGKVLLTGLNSPGSVAEVAGKPPFKVTVGNAATVQLLRDGRPFDLAPHTRDSVARVSIE
jgi:cytoskeleton protein RodZ